MAINVGKITSFFNFLCINVIFLGMSYAFIFQVFLNITVSHRNKILPIHEFLIPFESSYDLLQIGKHSCLISNPESFSELLDLKWSVMSTGLSDPLDLVRKMRKLNYYDRSLL